MRAKVWRWGAVTALLLGAIGGSVGAAHARGLSSHAQSQVERCVGFSMMGTFYDGIEINGDKFDCHPVQVQGNTRALTISGRVSHALRLRADDEVNFVIKLKNDIIDDISMKVESGGILATGQRGLAAAAQIKRSSGTAMSVGRIAGSMNTDFSDWKAIAELIVLSIASESARSVRERDTVGAVSFFFHRPGNQGGWQGEVKDGSYFDGITAQSRHPQTFIDLCRKRCEADKLCLSWTLERPSNQHNNQRYCALHSKPWDVNGQPQTQTIVLNKNFVSGRVR